MPSFSTQKTAAIGVALIFATASTFACDTPSYGSCGSASGTTCCPTGQYCQPWNPSYYQCFPVPSQCPKQFTDTDFYGDDLTSIKNIQPSDCCTKCAETAGCHAYTFVNNAPGGPVCYLKKGTGQNRPNKGAVSGIVNKRTLRTTSDDTEVIDKDTINKESELVSTSGCDTSAYAKCGADNESIKCCPVGQYCQPWNNNYYQCIATPPKCSTQYTNVNFYGNDIKTIYGLQPDACCDQCSKTPGCKAYTFVNDNPGQPACYLKTGQGQHRTKQGAVSGIVN